MRNSCFRETNEYLIGSQQYMKMTPALDLAEDVLFSPCPLHTLYRKGLEQIYIREKRQMNPNAKAMKWCVHVMKGLQCADTIH